MKLVAHVRITSFSLAGLLFGARVAAPRTSALAREESKATKSWYGIHSGC